MPEEYTYVDITLALLQQECVKQASWLVMKSSLFLLDTLQVQNSVLDHTP